MALINCPECGKEISNKAKVCPNCGYPIAQPTPIPTAQPAPIHTVQPTIKKNNACMRGCLIGFLGFLILFAVIGMLLALTADNLTTNSSKIAEFIEIPEDQGTAIDQILADCGIVKISSLEHDELLDNIDMDGETGYRMSANGIDNIILYLDPDKNVYSVRYADHDLYANESVVATLNDYCMNISEMTDWQLKCQDKVKEILKSPSTAKFPNISDWGFRKEKNIITIQSYVDSQNSFGAEIRSNFQFIIDSDANTIQSFIFDGQELITQ